MTAKEIKEQAQYQVTQMYLNYLAIQEIFLDYYEDCKWLTDFDRDLLTKHKNMVSSLKRNATKAYKFLENYDDKEVAIKSFHDFVRFHECIHKLILQEKTKYALVLDEIDQVLIKNGLKEKV
jgi:hypothetical protein